jgi:Gpi18-like mannosyltransferase
MSSGRLTRRPFAFIRMMWLAASVVAGVVIWVLDSGVRAALSTPVIAATGFFYFLVRERMFSGRLTRRAGVLLIVFLAVILYGAMWSISRVAGAS